MPMLPVDEGELYYEEHGTGPALLLVAGLGGVGSFWAPQLPALTPHFRVVIHDHRGTGRSSRDLISYSVKQMAADALALADGLGIGRFLYAGHSTGAAIGQSLLLDHPDRVEAAVLASGWARQDAWFARCFAVREDLLRWGGAEAYVRAQAMFLYPPWWVSAGDAALRAMEAMQIGGLPDPAILTSRIAAILDWGPGEALRAIDKPTLVTCADDDHLTPPHYSIEMHRLIPGSDLAILPTGGHFNTAARRDEFNEVLLGWLLARRAGRPWVLPPFARHDSAHHA